jgi:hypothetical protein
MNIVLTGATSPIGKVLANYLSAHNIVEVSRTSGWDLNNDIDRLIDATNGADVLINLAQVGYTQGIILERSKASINISFTSLITQFPYSKMKSLNGPDYIAPKLFLEHVHKDTPNSALVSISNYGDGPIPAVTDDQICDAIQSIISGKSILPTRIEVSNGTGGLSLNDL